MKRNEAYYQKFPEDVENVRQIASYIEKQGGSISLPAGGNLTVRRLMTIGIEFGGASGFDFVHTPIMNMKVSLDLFCFLTRASLTPMETLTPFDKNMFPPVPDWAFLDFASAVEGTNGNRTRARTMNHELGPAFT